MGPEQSAATLVGQCLGAGRPEHAERTVWLTGYYNTIFLGNIAGFFIFESEPMVGIFTDDARVLEIGSECLRVIGYGYIFYAWGMGAGDTMTPT